MVLQHYLVLPRWHTMTRTTVLMTQSQQIQTMSFTYYIYDTSQTESNFDHQRVRRISNGSDKFTVYTLFQLVIIQTFGIRLRNAFLFCCNGRSHPDRPCEQQQMLPQHALQNRSAAVVPFNCYCNKRRAETD